MDEVQVQGKEKKVECEKVCNLVKAPFHKLLDLSVFKYWIISTGSKIESNKIKYKP